MMENQTQIQISANIAPLPKEGVKPPDPKPSALDGFFDKLDAQLERRHEQAWRSDYLLWLRTLLTYTGKVLLQERKFGFGFDVVPIQTGDRLFVQNKLRFYSDDVVNQWVASDPKIDVLAMMDADDKRRRATRTARAINDHYNRLHFTEVFKQLTAKLAQFCGNYHAEVYFDQDAEGYAKQPVLGEVPVPGASSWQCGDCGMGGEGTVEACPSCGSALVQNDSVPDTVSQQVVGTETVRAGDIRCEPIPAWQLRYERGDFPERSDWMRRARDFPVEYLQGIFQGRKISPSYTEDQSIQPDRILRKATSAVQNATVYGNGSDDSFYAEFVEFWYEPCMYQDVVLTEDETLSDGRTIPAGTRLVEAFPKGIYRAKVRGNKGCLLMREESHKERVVSSQFILIPGRGVGDNIQDALEYQKQDTVLNSINFTAFMRAATPTLVVNDHLISEGALNTKPGGVITVSGRKLREGESVQSAFGIVPATPPTPALAQYLYVIEGGLQKALKSLTLDSGLTGFKSDTAYGDKMAQQKMALSRTSELALLAEWYKKISALRLKLAQRFLSDDRIIHYVGQAGQMEPMEFRAADIDCDFVLWVKSTSYMPDSPQLRQANLQGALEAITLLKAGGLLTPASQQLVDNIFDIELSGENGALYEDWMRQVLTLMEEGEPAAAVLAQMMATTPQFEVDPMTGQVVPVDPIKAAGESLAAAIDVDPYELGGEYKINLLRQWLSEEEGQEASKVLRAGVHAVIDQLLEGLAEEARRMAMMQGIAQPPNLNMPPQPQRDEAKAKDKQVENTPKQPKANPARMQ